MSGTQHVEIDMYITEPARRVPLHGEYEVVVLGGGPAGILAAASAARNGARVLLLERYGFPGGMGTAAGVSNFCGLHGPVRVAAQGRPGRRFQTVRIAAHPAQRPRSLVSQQTFYDALQWLYGWNIGTAACRY